MKLWNSTATTTSSSSGYPTAFGDYWYQDWQQYVYTAAELNALGLTAGNITSLTFDITGLPTADVSDYNDFLMFLFFQFLLFLLLLLLLLLL